MTPQPPRRVNATAHPLSRISLRPLHTTWGEADCTQGDGEEALERAQVAGAGTGPVARVRSRPSPQRWGPRMEELTGGKSRSLCSWFCRIHPPTAPSGKPGPTHSPLPAREVSSFPFSEQRRPSHRGDALPAVDWTRLGHRDLAR